MAVEEKVDVSEQVFADVIKGTAAPVPLFPCLKEGCGKPTKEHHTPAGSRICSDKGCRAIITGKDIETSRVLGEAMTPVVIPCKKCGKPTKEHHTPEKSRICSSKACRHIHK